MTVPVHSRDVDAIITDLDAAGWRVTQRRDGLWRLELKAAPGQMHGVGDWDQIVAHWRGQCRRPLLFPSDVGLRRRFFDNESFRHPAKLHLGFLQWLIERYTWPGAHIADPMAGSGSLLIATMTQRDVTLMDVESDYCDLMRRNAERINAAAGFFAGRYQIVSHDARQPWPVKNADCVLFSPPYGCSMSRSATAKGILPRTFRAGNLGKRWRQFLANPTAGSVGAQRFYYGSDPAQIGHLRNEAYWQEMQHVYQRAWEALRTDGMMVVVIKDHIRHGVRVRVCDQTVALCKKLQFSLIDRHVRKLQTLSLWQRRRREQGKPVIDEEEALIFRRLEEP